MPVSPVNCSPLSWFNPVLLDGPGVFDLRWYALAYIFGLILAWRYVLWITRKRELWAAKGASTPKDPAFTRDDIDELLFLATIGVIVGGRLGYVLFYMHKTNPGWWLVNGEFDLVTAFLRAINVTAGGMSFHGGLLGVGAAIWWLAHSRNKPTLRIADVAAIATPIGLLLGRIANFINGELYGRVVYAERTFASDGAAYTPAGEIVPVRAGETVTTAVSADNAPWWAMNFPCDTLANRVFEQSGLQFEFYRHASQLYEAFLEGAVLLAIQFVVMKYYRGLSRPGLHTGIFLAGYAIFRSFVELFREPDKAPGGSFIDAPFGLTMGQFLSVPMIVGGVALIIWALRQPPVGQITKAVKPAKVVTPPSS